MLDAMADLFDTTDSNVAWDTPEADGITPHQRLYREAVSRVLDAAAQRQVADGPPAQILIGRPPVETHPRASGTFAAAVYEAELHAAAGRISTGPRPSASAARSSTPTRRRARDGSST
nr:hypothetical protein [Wenxinia marina]